MALTAELIRKGAAILQEPCPRCGSVQIRYNGKIYCTNEDDLQSLLNPEARTESPPPGPAKVEPTHDRSSQSFPDTTGPLRKLLQDKLDALSKQLESTTDAEEQAKILNLISKYLETLEKAKKADK